MMMGKYEVAITNDNRLGIRNNKTGNRLGIRNSKTGQFIPDDEPVFLLRARDLLAYQTLQAYYILNKEKEADLPPDHMRDLLIRVETFARFILSDTEKMKLPGVPVTGG